MVLVQRPSIRQVPGTSSRVIGVFGNVQDPANRAIGRALAQNLPALLEAGDIVVCTFLYQSHVIDSESLTRITISLTRLKSYQVDSMELLQGSTS